MTTQQTSSAHHGIWEAAAPWPGWAARRRVAGQIWLAQSIRYIEAAAA